MTARCPHCGFMIPVYSSSRLIHFVCGCCGKEFDWVNEEKDNDFRKAHNWQRREYDR